MQPQYSIWLMPSGEVFSKFRNIISELALEQASPLFEPHVTLLGGIEGNKEDMISKTFRLANFLQPVEIKLGEVAYLDEYFRSLFVKAESKALDGAHAMAQKIFGVKQKYEPHMSLMYGDFLPGKKKEIMKRIGSRFDDKFVAESLKLFLTSGEVEYWKNIKEFKLKK